MEESKEMISLALGILDKYSKLPAKEMCRKWNFSETEECEKEMRILIDCFKDLFTGLYDKVNNLTEDQIICVRGLKDNKDVYHEYLTTTKNYRKLQNKYIKYDNSLGFIAKMHGKTLEDIMQNINSEKPNVKDDDILIVRVFPISPYSGGGPADKATIQVFPFDYLKEAVQCISKIPWMSMLYRFVNREEGVALDDHLETLSYQQFENVLDKLIDNLEIPTWE